MNQQQADHQTATIWIGAEMKVFSTTVGQPNASSAVRSLIDLATLLRVISIDEKRAFSAEVDRIVNEYNAQFKEVA